MRTVSISEARERFAAMVKWASKNRDDVIIQKRGRSEVVLIPYADYELLMKAREEDRRKAAIAELKVIAEAVGRRNKAMDVEEADSIADSITREAIENLVKEGKISFQD
jgi:prevent-host-death family protein